ncbi:MAG TPA: DUF4389 domain-containing protein [Actinomycetota bacterium]|nr:DUF4389 domain-containing protein [Actinomycetota bacterium]
MSVAEGAPVPPALVVERVERRGRLSVAFRLLLLLPQLVVLYVLLLVGLVAVVLGWFAALVLGRLPEPIARYLGHLTRYTTRVYAYGWLLTDRYPPFRLSAEDYPVTVELAPGRLNRLAVLFRVLLAIPASILAGLVVAGWSVAAFFIWLLVLVAGRVPGALFDATTAVLRYNTRTTAYTWLVTAAYPGGLFGDRPVPPGPPAPAADPVTAMPAGPTEELEPPRAPRGLLVLSTGAKRLVVLFLVLGVAQYVAGGAVSATTTSNARRTTEARSDLTAAYDILAGRVQQYQQQVAACPPEMSCIQPADRELAAAFDAFATEMRRIDFPASAQADAAELQGLADRVASTFRELATAGSPQEYERLAAPTAELGNSFDQRVQALVTSLSA